MYLILLQPPKLGHSDNAHYINALCLKFRPISVRSRGLVSHNQKPLYLALSHLGVLEPEESIQFIFFYFQATGTNTLLILNTKQAKLAWLVENYFLTKNKISWQELFAGSELQSFSLPNTSLQWFVSPHCTLNTFFLH